MASNINLPQLADSSNDEKSFSFFVESNSLVSEFLNTEDGGSICDKKKCSQCNKKLKIMNEFLCKCEKIFCTKHKYPDTHKCSYDHKLHWKNSIRSKNPIVAAKKIDQI